MTQSENYFFTKETELFFTSEPCDIFYNEELKAVETNWKGLFIKGEEFRGILNKIIEALDIKKAGTVIADARNMKIISEEDHHWMLDEWFPNAKKAGFRRQALIVIKNTFIEHSLKKIVKHYDPDEIITQYFTNHKDAMDWIKSGGNLI